MIKKRKQKQKQKTKTTTQKIKNLKKCMYLMN